MSLSVIGRTVSHPFLRVLSVFWKTTPGDGAGAAASAPHTLWGVTPSAGWTVHQKQTGGFQEVGAGGWNISTSISRANSPTLQFYENALLLFVGQSEKKRSRIRLIQVHAVWFEKVQMVKRWIHVYFKQQNSGAQAQRRTHPEADERQISPDFCVLLDQMAGLNQSLLSCNQLLQLCTHTHTHA